MCSSSLLQYIRKHVRLRLKQIIEGTAAFWGVFSELLLFAFESMIQKFLVCHSVDNVPAQDAFLVFL